MTTTENFLQAIVAHILVGGNKSSRHNSENIYHKLPVPTYGFYTRYS